jgi:hypothetical protein
MSAMLFLPPYHRCRKIGINKFRVNKLAAAAAGIRRFINSRLMPRPSGFSGLRSMLLSNCPASVANPASVHQFRLQRFK